MHALGGLWGLLAVCLLAQFPETGGGQNQWIAQVAAVATLVGLVLPLTYALNWLLDRFRRQRVEVHGERQGLDLHELGASAYPEFMSHNEDLW